MRKSIFKKLVTLGILLSWGIGILALFPMKASVASDGIEDFVRRCYSLALQREPEEEGLNNWVNSIKNGERVGSTVVYWFIFSDEYVSQNKTDEEFVNDLYTMFLGRPADQEGYDTWCGLLQEGWSREQVFGGFANSVEFDGVCSSCGITAGFYTPDYPIEQVNQVNLFVERMYKTCLGRLGDQGGQQTWVQGLLDGTYSGTGCAENFIKSTEYVKLGLDDEEYVENLYKSFMGRDSDEAGKEAWVEGLQNGTLTRDQVFAGFANSTEFEGICNVYAIDQGNYEASDPATGSDTYGYTVLTDANGNVYDLGGVEVIIRDWFSNDLERPEAKSEYEEALYAYQEWIQETYNFKVHAETIGDWGSAAKDFVDYSTAGGDDNYYVFTVPGGFTSTIQTAIDKGLVYDLSTIDCLDWSKKEFTANNMHKKWSVDGGIYAFAAGYAEPRTGIMYNRRLLQEAGIDPNLPYDLQAAGEWTWDAWEEILKKVQRDTDNDGDVDIWGICVNEGVMIHQAVLSNGGSYVTQKNGDYVYNMESDKTVEALEWTLEMFQKYDWDGPNDAYNNPPAWDYYQKQFRNGGAVFCIDQQYCFTPGNLFYDMEDELGFVCFPKGPHGKLCQQPDDNLKLIPSCYDDEKAWKCAFAYMLYYDFVPGYEDYNKWVGKTLEGNVDARAAETINIMCNNNVIDYCGMVTNFDPGANLEWKIGPNTTATIEEIIAQSSVEWKMAVKTANGEKLSEEERNKYMEENK